MNALTDRRVALIRGINVGRAKRVAMADLRTAVAALGYLDVRTLLNSGNLIFTVPARLRGDPATRIEQAMASRVGVAARVTVLTAAEVAGVLSENPLGSIAENPSRLLLYVLRDPRDRSKLTALARQRWAPEVLALGRRVAYLWCPGGVLDSRVAAAIDRVLGDGVTARNWNTMTKLHALVGPTA